MTQPQAAVYLGVEESWLDDPPFPWLDMRKPGRKRAVRRFLRRVLDEWLETRLVQPGRPSPFAHG